MIGMACREYETMQRVLTGETLIRSKNFEHSFDEGTIIASLAKSFIFFLVRARRIMQHDAATINIDRNERVRFLKATEAVVAVRDVNEHGFERNTRSPPEMHQNNVGLIDETSIYIGGPTEVIIGPLNICALYVPAKRANDIAGLHTLPPTPLPIVPLRP